MRSNPNDVVGYYSGLAAEDTAEEEALQRHSFERPGLKGLGKELRLKTVPGMPGPN